MTSYLKLSAIENLFTGEPPKPKTWYEELEEKVCSSCPALTYQQRIGGCLSFMVIGFIISMGSTLRLIELVKGNPGPFAIMYTSGNLISICATCFLYGPWSQAKKMFAPTRTISTLIYIFFMCLTLFLAFYPGHISFRVLLLIMCIFAQFLALCWYTISFIPFARDLVLNCLHEACCRSCKLDCCDEGGSAGTADPFWA